MRNPLAALAQRQAFAALAAFAFAALPMRGVATEITRATIPAPAGMANHGAAIAELRSGALLACWFSGLHEEDRSVRILCSRGAADGSSWSPPWTAVAPGDRAKGAVAPDKSLGNVTLTVSPGGRVWMIHGVIQSSMWPIVGEMCRNWACGRIDARVSDDEGRTWSPAQRLVDVDGALPRAELKPVSDGWLAPIYEETAQRSAIAKVKLDGDTAVLERIWRLDGWKLIQPALVRQPDGRFRAYFRDQRRRVVDVATFDSVAGAWRNVSPTNLPNPGAAVDAFSDGEGRDVVIYNPSSTKREALALARSSDGVSFTRGCDLSRPGEKGAAYPSVVRAGDGAWLVVYSTGLKSGIGFVRFTRVWLDDCFAGKG